MKKSLKIISIITFIILASVMFTVTVSAEDATITVGSATGRSGDTVSVPVNISGQPTITGYDMTIEFDITKLQYTGYTRGQFDFDLNIVTNVNNANKDGRITFSVAKSDLEDFTLEDGVLSTLRFTILAGKGDTMLEITDLKFVKANNDEVPSKSVNGKITIEVDQYKVTFDDTDDYTITVKAGEEAIASGTSVDDGTELTITVTPASADKVLDKISVNGTAITGTTYKVAGEDVNITATVKDKPTEQYTVTFTDTADYTITVKDGDKPITSGTKVDDETELTITVTSLSADKVLDKILVNGTAISGTTYTVAGADANITAALKDKPVVKLGDVNYDGKIDADDATAVFEYIMRRKLPEKVTVDEDMFLEAANIIKTGETDGKPIIDIEDLMAISRYIKGVPGPLGLPE